MEKGQYIHHLNESHTSLFGSKLNWLRASVLGANYGIVSIAELLVGFACASNTLGFICYRGNRRYSRRCALGGSW